MRLEIGKKALITCDAWFYAPDGKSYRAVFGTVHAVRTSEEALGVRTNARSTNWYVEVGNLTLAGCQIHYAVRCDEVNLGEVLDSRTTDNGETSFQRQSQIYDADRPRMIG